MVVHGVDGALLTTNSIDDDWDYNVYFAGRTVWREQVSGSSIMPPMPVSPDRLGSNVKHFPFGDEPSTTAQNREKFATYYRDEVTALDYARNRYYSSTIARFTTADPYGPSARPGAPQTWNRYTYVGGDPVNFGDPAGLADCYMGGDGVLHCYEDVRDLYSGAKLWRATVGGGGDVTRYFGPIELQADLIGPEPGEDAAARNPCDTKDPTNARVLNYIDSFSAAARALSQQSGLSAGFILAWAAFESGYGTGDVAGQNNNFFGLTIADPAKNGWLGAVACTDSGSKFACFSGDGLGPLFNSGYAALFSQNEKYLTAALQTQAAGGTFAAIAAAIAASGFNSEPLDYGGLVGAVDAAIRLRQDCPR